MTSLQKIERKIVGKTVVATIDGKKHTLTLEAEPKKKLVEMIERYNKRPSKTAFDKIFKQFNAKAEKVKELALVQKKVQKRTLKDAEQELDEARKNIKLLTANVEDLMKLSESQKLKLDELAKKSAEAEAKIKQEPVVQSPRPWRGEY